jgi:hypothetical protein
MHSFCTFSNRRPRETFGIKNVKVTEIFEELRKEDPRDLAYIVRIIVFPISPPTTAGQENMELCIHSPTRLHGVVLRELNTGTTLPFTFHLYLKAGSSKNWNTYSINS